MRKMRKLSLLVVSAVAAMALAGPASASAASWWQEGVPLTESKSIEMDGKLGMYSNAGGGFNCPVHLDATIGPGSGGQITGFTADPSNCVTTGSIAGACQIKSLSITKLPVGLQAENNGTVAVSSATFSGKWHTGGGCPVKEFTAPMSLKLTPDNQEEISSFSISRTAGAFDDAYGELDVSPALQYGFSE